MQKNESIDARLRQELDELCSTLRDAKDFSVPLDRYMDLLGSSLDLEKHSTSAEHPVLVEVLRVAIDRILPGGKIVHMILKQMPAHGFWYGALLSTSGMGIFFAFESSQQVCVGVPQGGQKTSTLRLTWHNNASVDQSFAHG